MAPRTLQTRPYNHLLLLFETYFGTSSVSGLPATFQTPLPPWVLQALWEIWLLWPNSRQQYCNEILGYHGSDWWWGICCVRGFGKRYYVSGMYDALLTNKLHFFICFLIDVLSGCFWNVVKYLSVRRYQISCTFIFIVYNITQQLNKCIVPWIILYCISLLSCICPLLSYIKQLNTISAM